MFSEKKKMVIKTFKNILDIYKKISFYYVIENQKKNIFLIGYDSIIYFLKKYIFKKIDNNKKYILNYVNNLDIKLIISFILSSSIVIAFSFFMLIFSIKKDHYIDSNINQNNINNTVESNSKKDNKDEKEKAETVRISEIALDEEINAQNSYNASSYSFDVNRKIKTLKKVHIFSNEDWNSINNIINEETEFVVDKIVSPSGYLMYKIAEGEYKGNYITANEKLVEVIDKNDNFSFEFVDKPIKLKILSNITEYTDVELKNVKQTVYKGTEIKAVGFLIKSNRLVYKTYDNNFLPIDPTKITEQEFVQEQPIKKENKNTKNNNKIVKSKKNKK